MARRLVREIIAKTVDKRKFGVEFRIKKKPKPRPRKVSSKFEGYKQSVLAGYNRVVAELKSSGMPIPQTSNEIARLLEGQPETKGLGSYIIGQALTELRKEGHMVRRAKQGKRIGKLVRKKKPK